MKKNELIKLIRENTGGSMLEAKAMLERISHGMGVLTRRDQIALEIYANISSIPDSLENRKKSAAWAVECADELIDLLDKGPKSDA